MTMIQERGFGVYAHQQSAHDVAKADGQVLGQLPQHQREGYKPYQVLPHPAAPFRVRLPAGRAWLGLVHMSDSAELGQADVSGM